MYPEGFGITFVTLNTTSQVNLPEMVGQQCVCVCDLPLAINFFLNNFLHLYDFFIKSYVSVCVFAENACSVQ